VTVGGGSALTKPVWTQYYLKVSIARSCHVGPSSLGSVLKPGDRPVPLGFVPDSPRTHVLWERSR
jgi:hypothetical protein